MRKEKFIHSSKLFKYRPFHNDSMIQLLPISISQELETAIQLLIDQLREMNPSG